MNFSLKNESHLPFYRSQVMKKEDKIPLFSKDTKITNLKQSFVEKPGKFQMLNPVKQQDKNSQQKKINNVKNNVNLHSPRVKGTIYSPLLTCRSVQNLGPKAVRENPYFPENDAKLEENRSVKFIANLRGQMSSNEKANQCSRVTKKHEKIWTGSSKNAHEKNLALLLALTEKNRELQRQLLQDSNITENIGVKFDDQISSESVDLNSQQQSFEKKLVIRCKNLEQDLEVKQEQILNLQNTLKNLQLKHISELNDLKNQHSHQISKKNYQIQQLKCQLADLESINKTIQKTKISKQKIYQEQIQKYLKELTQSEQSKNKMILQFQDVLKRRLQANEKSCSERFSSELKRVLQENNSLKNQLQNLWKTINQKEKEKQKIIEESKCFHLELTNYIMLNNELTQENLCMKKKMDETQRLNKKYTQEIGNQQQKMKTVFEIETRCQQVSSVLQKLSQQIQILKFENNSLRNQIHLKQKSHQKQKQTQNKQIYHLKSKLISCQKDNSRTKQEANDLKKKILNTNNQKQEYTAILETKIQQLQIEIEEWKFICESSTLNRSLILESHH